LTLEASTGFSVALGFLCPHPVGPVPLQHINVHARWCCLLGFLHNGCGASWCCIRRRDFIHIDDFWGLRWLLFSSCGCDFVLVLLRGCLTVWLGSPYLGGAMVVKLSFAKLGVLCNLHFFASYVLSLCAFPDFAITFLLSCACFVLVSCEACWRHYRNCALIEPLVLAYLPLISLVVASWRD
jgi:hypothetical protein